MRQGWAARFVAEGAAGGCSGAVMLHQSQDGDKCDAVPDDTLRTLAGTNAMQGSAMYGQVAGAQAIVLGVAPVLLVVDLIYQATIVYVYLFYASVSACVAASMCDARLCQCDDRESGETYDAKKAVPGSASVRSKGKRLTMFSLLMAVHTWQRMMLLPISSFTVSELHDSLQEQARRNFASAELDSDDSGADDWGVLFRAGGPWHGGPANITWKSQALPATCNRKCFLLHLGALESALGGSGRHLVIPVGADATDWRGAVLERIRALDERLVPMVAFTPCLLSGKELGPSCSPVMLQDFTVRLWLSGLRGGAPKGKQIVAARDVDQMEKAELMAYAKDVLGVETRRAGLDGKKNLWRKVSEVKQECKAAHAKLSELEAENESTPGSASALLTTGSASSSSHTMPVPNLDKKKRSLSLIRRRLLIRAYGTSVGNQLPKAKPKSGKLPRS